MQVVLKLAAGAFVCAVIAGLVAHYVHLKCLPPSDLAHGTPFVTLLQDPFVLIVMGEMVLVGWLFGFAFSLWALWRANLSKAVPVVTLVTVGFVAVSTPVFGLLSAFLGLLAGITAMFWFRYAAAEASTPATR